MPNYEIVDKFCNLRNKKARCPAIYDARAGAPDHFDAHINDCLAKDPACKDSGCKFAGGQKEPFSS